MSASGGQVLGREGEMTGAAGGGGQPWGVRVQYLSLYWWQPLCQAAAGAGSQVEGE